MTGTMPAQPTDLACYETATFNTTTCVSGCDRYYANTNLLMT
ncbi:MAG: hypothetical protein R2805_06565 [Flavobacterium sp.]